MLKRLKLGLKFLSDLAEEEEAGAPLVPFPGYPLNKPPKELLLNCFKPFLSFHITQLRMLHKTLLCDYDYHFIKYSFNLQRKSSKSIHLQ